MASSTLHKLLKRSQYQSAAKIFTQFRINPSAPLTQIPKICESGNSICPETDFTKPNPSKSSYAYPTFSFEFFLNPNPPPLLIQEEVDEEAIPDDSATIRADSVKKKRKKKMNKHKLRKLRKRLRRKTKK